MALTALWCWTIPLPAVYRPRSGSIRQLWIRGCISSRSPRIRSTRTSPLNIEGEWLRLKEIIQEVPQAITLERTRPPTLEQLRRLVANRKNRVVHFMGHGGQSDAGAVLFFENDGGAPQPVTAKNFTRRVRGTIFLATLNGCVSATPGLTAFGNLAAALVQRQTPYVLGMRFSIVDEDAGDQGGGAALPLGR